MPLAVVPFYGTNISYYLIAMLNGANFEMLGSAIYVYCVLANSHSEPKYATTPRILMLMHLNSNGIAGILI